MPRKKEDVVRLMAFGRNLRRKDELEKQYAELRSACEGLLRFVRQKYSLAEGEPFQCPHMRAIDKALKR